MPTKAPATSKPTKEAASAPAPKAAAKDSGKAAKSAPAATTTTKTTTTTTVTKTATTTAKAAAAPAKATTTTTKAATSAKTTTSTNKAAAPAKTAPAKNTPKATAPAAKAPAKSKTTAKGEPKAAPPPKAAVRKEPRAAPAGVYVNNWGRSGVDAARALFEGCGKVSAIRLRRSKYCQVWFENAASIKKACDISRDKRGRTIKVVPAKSFPKADRREHTKVVCLHPIFRKTTTRKQIFEKFGTAGKIVKLRTYANNTAFVYYDNAASASKAIAEFSGKEFQNNKLVVKPSVRSLESDKKKEENRRTIIDLYRWMAQQRA